MDPKKREIYGEVSQKVRRKPTSGGQGEPFRGQDTCAET